MTDSQKFKPTYVLFAANIAVYIYTSIAGGSFFETSIDMIVQYGQINGLVLGSGYYWQLFTSMFVHASLMHLVGNMLFLIIFGLRSEEMFALHEYLLIYFLGGLTGNLLSLVSLDANVPSVGASGAIFALFGACTVYARRAVGQSIVGALIYAFFLVFLSSGPNVNNSAHIGGLITGLVIGYLLAARRKFATKYEISYSYYHGF
ncbi:MAG: rhomboid family intramembrane serine protease [Candidatus Bathyarchaeia archaeon]